MSSSGLRFLAGREREVASIEERLELAADGHGAILLIAGEPGIGKTRLLEEAARRASERGFAVVWGRAPELGSAPPYWPWVEALRALVVGELVAAASVATLARLLPELAGPWSGEERAGPADPFPVHDAIAAVLHVAAARQPVLVLLDDLHAADPSSLQVAELVAPAIRTARVMIAGSYRDFEARRAPAVEASLGRLGRRGEVLEPRRLDRAQVAAMVEASLSHDDPEVTRMIHDASEGNPLFVRELLKLIAARGVAHSDVPGGARLVIRERLALLSPSSVALLQAAAVVGRQFAPGIAAEVAGVTPDALDEALGEARDAEIVIAIDGGRWQFSHALVAETLAVDAPAAARMRLHRRAAEALARRALGDPQAPFGEIARHWRLAGSEHAARAAAATERVALAASERLAFADAAAAYGELLASLAVLPASDASAADAPRRRAELLIAQTDAYARAGDRARAEESAALAIGVAGALNDRVLAARTALAFGVDVMVGRIDAALVLALSDALARFPPEDDPWRAMLTARLAAAQQPSRDPRVPIAAAREALAMARRLGDPKVLGEVLFATGSALADYGPATERAAIDEECARLMLTRGDRARALRALQRLAFDRIDLGDRLGFERVLTELEAHAEAIGLARFRAVPPMLRAMQAGWEGRYEDEARHLEISYALREQAGDPMVGFVRDVRRAMSALWRENRCHEDVYTLLTTTMDRVEQRAPVVRAWTWCLQGRTAEARELVAGFEARGILALHYDVHALHPLAQVAWFLRDRTLAAVAYEHLREHAGRPFSVTGLAGLLMGFVDHELMRLALVLGRREEAERWAESARDLCTRLGASPWIERVREDLAGFVAVAAPVTFERAGDVWTVSGLGEVGRVKDSRGVQMLARLVAEPGRELHVIDVSGSEGVDLGDAGPAIDPAARRAYQERMRSLREELEEAEGWHDEARRARLEHELERLTAELSAAYGLGGRARKSGATVERARSNVRRRIVDALERIAEVSPVLGSHLERSVRTGVFCCYAP